MKTKKRGKEKAGKRNINKNKLIALVVILVALLVLSIILKNINLTTKAIEDSCIPNWKCTQFAPEKCPAEGVRTRVCTDLNDCGTPQSMPKLEEECTSINSYLIWIIIAVLLMIILIVLLTILRRLIKRENQEFITRPKVEPRSYRRHPSYPSELEQYYASDRTYDLKAPVPEKPNEENLYSEKFPENYWPE